MNPRTEETAMPSDRINLAEIELPGRVSGSSIGREYIRRFYEQEFTSRHLLACLLTDPRTKHRSSLKELARSIVSKEHKAGRIVLVRQGATGECSVFRNKEAA